ncbi:cytochrome c oxidase subunit 3 family protein [Nevskia ramosa]|uniref:cytochrome c oxidase subunit 3 family protein n=1 Tax=Nevskia ramosa TaxID=64002 RepID=UPI003D110319
MSNSSEDTALARGGKGHIPGEAGIWLLIAGDLLMFSVLFVIFLVCRAGDLTVFQAGHARLNQTWGLVNTILMLSSSWLVATAIQAARRQMRRVVVACFGLALLCGLGFIVVKVFEYSEKIRADLTLTTNDFFMLYFSYTGIHLIHVVIGMGVLTTLMLYSRSGNFVPGKLRNLESGASFWHLVDLLWIVLFALLYLVGAK